MSMIFSAILKKKDKLKKWLDKQLISFIAEVIIWIIS